MKKCPACGEQIADDFGVCPQCGTNVHVAQTQGWLAAPGSPPGCNLRFVALVGLICFGCLGLTLLHPKVQGAREAARRSQCKNNLKLIGLALHKYHDTYGSFPPAFIADAHGDPMHSWRVLILPFLEEQTLYAEYNFDEPWDGPKNSRLLPRMPSVYYCPSDPDAGAPYTCYAAVTGEHCALRGKDGVCRREITDGLSDTLLVGEVAARRIPWMKPEDVEATTLEMKGLGTPDGFSSGHYGGVQIVFADGGVRWVSNTTPLATLKALCTRDGGEKVDDF